MLTATRLNEIGCMPAVKEREAETRGSIVREVGGESADLRFGLISVASSRQVTNENHIFFAPPPAAHRPPPTAPPLFAFNRVRKTSKKILHSRLGDFPGHRCCPSFSLGWRSIWCAPALATPEIVCTFTTVVVWHSAGCSDVFASTHAVLMVSSTLSGAYVACCARRAVLAPSACR